MKVTPNKEFQMLKNVIESCDFDMLSFLFMPIEEMSGDIEYVEYILRYIVKLINKHKQSNQLTEFFDEAFTVEVNGSLKFSANPLKKFISTIFQYSWDVEVVIFIFVTNIFLITK